MSGPAGGPVDERLSRSVMDALWRLEPIRTLARLQAVARDGRVILRGIVATEPQRQTALDLARKLPGVREVIDELVTDEALERRVAVALASNARIRSLRIVVRVRAGVASLYGAVPSLELAESIRNIALEVPHLAGACSQLRVIPSGVPVVLAWQHSIEGRPLPSVHTGDESAKTEPAAAEEPEKLKAVPRPAGMEGTA